MSKDMVEIIGGPAMRVKEAALFAFDDVCLPFRRNMVTHLIPGKMRSKPRIVVPHGPPGSHDESAHYYGTTIRIDDEFRMWYIGRVGVNTQLANMEGFNGRLCYAVSGDGVNWEKPSLGLVEYQGSKDNNIVDLPQDMDIMAGIVLYEPEDPDPNRRFKINFEAGREDIHTRMCVAYSPDGLRWTPSPNNPVGPRLEQSGLIKWKGAYYVDGQGPGQPGLSRKHHTYVSYDFEKWSEAGVLSMSRGNTLQGPELEDITRTGTEVHLGAALHNRGNVIIGIYGQWSGHPTGDRRFINVNLGFTFSHDGMHFTEPIKDFAFIPAREEPESTIGWAPAAMQGQGMENFRDETIYWYSLWRLDGQVRVTTWERDRLSYITPCAPNPVDNRDGAQVISTGLRCPDNSEVFLNISGLGDYGSVRVEVLDEAFYPVKGYSGDQAAVVRESGLRVPVEWPEGKTLPKIDKPLRVGVRFGPVSPECTRPEDIKLYAIYVNAQGAQS